MGLFWLRGRLEPEIFLYKMIPLKSEIILVAGAGLEPATSRLWAWRAANCSTPRRSTDTIKKNIFCQFGGRGGNRTHMVVKPYDFESYASACSATRPIIA